VSGSGAAWAAPGRVGRAANLGHPRLGRGRVGRAADHIRAGHQPDYGQGAWSHGATDVARHHRQGDRIIVKLHVLPQRISRFMAPREISVKRVHVRYWGYRLQQRPSECVGSDDPTALHERACGR